MEPIRCGNCAVLTKTEWRCGNCLVPDYYALLKHKCYDELCEAWRKSGDKPITLEEQASFHYDLEVHNRDIKAKMRHKEL